MCLDARRKQAKREALDQAIASVKSDIVNLTEDQQTRLEAIGYGAEEDPEELVRRKDAKKDFHKHTLDLIRAFQKSDGHEHQQQLPISATSISTDRQRKQTGLHGSGEHKEVKDGQVLSADSTEEDNFRIRYLDKGRVARSEASECVNCKPPKPEHQREQVSKPERGIHDELPEKSMSMTDGYRLVFGSPGHFLGRRPEEVWNSPETPYFSNRNRMQREAAIARLVYKLVLSYLVSPEVEEGTWPDTISLSFPDGRSISVTSGSRFELERKIDDLTHRLRVLNGLRTNLHAMSSIEDLSFPSYQTFSKPDRQAEASYAAVQNDALRDVFVQSTCPNTLFSRLCSALLAQTYAPNIHTYNLLIIRLCHAMFFNAAEYVIEALFNSGINHNEVTFAAILNCYTYKKKRSSFRGYLNRMKLTSGNAVRTSFISNEDADAQISGLYLPQERDIQTLETTPDSGHNTMYGEKAKRNAEVFEAIILGLLDIQNLHEAMLEYSSMLSHGISPSLSILDRLLQYCVKTANSELGNIVWDRITQSFRPVPTMTYYWMLQLCVVCEDPEHFETVLHHGLYHQVLTARLRYSEFELNLERRDQLNFRAFAIRRLEQNVPVPGYAESTASSSLHDLPQLPNLYLMVLGRFLALAQAKRLELGWFVDFKNQASHASSEFSRLHRPGLLSDRRMSSMAKWLSTKSKAEQAVNHVAPLDCDILPEIIAPRKADLLTIDLSKPLGAQKADTLRSYLLKLQSGNGFRTKSKPAAIKRRASATGHVRRHQVGLSPPYKRLNLRTTFQETFLDQQKHQNYQELERNASTQTRAAAIPIGYSEASSHPDLPTGSQKANAALVAESTVHDHQKSTYPNALETTHVWDKTGLERAKHLNSSVELEGTEGTKGISQPTRHTKGITAIVRLRRTMCLVCVSEAEQNSIRSISTTGG